MMISFGDDLRLRDKNGGGFEREEWVEDFFAAGEEEMSVRVFFADTGADLWGEEGKDEAGGTTSLSSFLAMDDFLPA